MSATPFLDDVDFNYSELIKARLENVETLPDPETMGLEQAGYSVYYNNKIWVWDGEAWKTWEHTHFGYEDTVIDGDSPRSEATAFNIESYNLDGSYFNSIMSLGYDDYVPRTLGTVHLIGTISELYPWDERQSSYVVFTAKDGSWFNIKNSSSTVQSKFRKIITMTGTDLFGIKKAVFVYDFNLDAWFVLSVDGATLPLSAADDNTLRYDATSKIWLADTFLTNTGTRVGIGVAEPTVPFDVAGNMKVTATDADGAIKFVIHESGTKIPVCFDNSGANGHASVGIITKTGTNAGFVLRHTNSSGDGFNIVLDNSNPGNLLFVARAATNTEVMRLTNAGYLGIGSSNPLGILHAITAGVATTTPLFERNGQTSDSIFSVARFLATKSTNMGDGFGSVIQFAIKDDAGVINPIGYIGAVRAGADNTGDLVFYTFTNGSVSEKVRVKSNGNTDIVGTLGSNTLAGTGDRYVLANSGGKLIAGSTNVPTWFKRYIISDSGQIRESQITGNFPSSGTEGLPYNGFYKVDIYIQVVEWDANGAVQVNVEGAETLELSAPGGDGWIFVDTSGCYNPNAGVGDPVGVWENNSLQGSAILYVNDSTIGTRDISYRATFPNGTYNQIIGGYMHVQYLGATEGANAT